MKFIIKPIYIFILGVFVVSLLCGCGVNPKQIKRMQILETGVSNPTTIEELKDAIEKYQHRVEDITSAAAQTGIWYKILASRYLDKGMYGEALKYYQKAIEYFPTNQNLYYWVGVCAGYMAKSSLDYNGSGNFSQKENYLKLSESAYLRALELEPTYARALYGLSVLYVFDLDESEKAIPLLEKLLTIETRNTDAMMILARAYYENYDFDSAVALYDKIISISTSPEKKAAAEANKKQALEMSYGE